MTGEQLIEAGGRMVGDPNTRSPPSPPMSEDANYSTCLAKLYNRYGKDLVNVTDRVDRIA
jgi:hypothetical protein